MIGLKSPRAVCPVPMLNPDHYFFLGPTGRFHARVSFIKGDVSTGYDLAQGSDQTDNALSKSSLS